ncbi:DnaJ multi-domain protein [Pyrenophora tritici-repentis]|nr:DnaJ multi-domain protein [Pyrenophora tritici-repentis]
MDKIAMYNSATSRRMTRSQATAASSSVSRSTASSSATPPTAPMAIRATTGRPIAALPIVSVPTLATPTSPAARTAALPFPIIRKSATKKRRQDFDIFVDDTTTYLPTPASPPATPNVRTPLGVRTANLTPLPPSRLPDTPFTFSQSDPNWEDIENYTPWYLTPPHTPRTHTLARTPPVGPSPRPSPLANRLRLRPRRAKTSAELPAPVNVAAYHILDIEDWKVCANTIKTAYRVAALLAHPDKAATTEEKTEATALMQRINAAKDMLVNSSARRQYHRDGKVPWEV